MTLGILTGLILAWGSREMAKRDLSIDEIRDIAYLARLSFTDEELEGFREKFISILDMVERLQGTDTDDIEALTHFDETDEEGNKRAIDNSQSFEDTKGLLEAASEHTDYLFTVRSFTARELKK